MPSKRLYQSIIADYNTELAICELIDNSIDLWTKGGKKYLLKIAIHLDTAQQCIKVVDTAGGLKESDVKLIIAPGHTSNSASNETIGVFGVGSKRAVVALAQEIKIRTRYKKERTLLIEYSDEWLEKENWDLNYHLDSTDIEPNSTIIELTKLRSVIDDSLEKDMIEHTGAIYAKLLSNPNLELQINGIKVVPIQFDQAWSFPPNYAPQEIIFDTPINDTEVIKVRLLGGLIAKSEVGQGDYGVYFYCNDRMVLRADKSFTLGFYTGGAGLPHPDINTLRVFVYLHGNPERMPWTSSKSSINFQNKVFLGIRDRILQLVFYFARLARKFANNADENIYQYTSGTIDKVELKPNDTVKLYPLPTPQKQASYQAIVKEKNKKVAESKPWVIGLYEGIILADELFNSNFSNKNRFALIITDSTFEIAIKEFLVHVVAKKPPVIGSARLTAILLTRTQVEAEVKRHLGSKISARDWVLLDHYYKMRCNLIHQVAILEVKDSDIEKHRRLVEKVLSIMFRLQF